MTEALSCIRPFVAACVYNGVTLIPARFCGEKASSYLLPWSTEWWPNFVVFCFCRCIGMFERNYSYLRGFPKKLNKTKSLDMSLRDAYKDESSTYKQAREKKLYWKTIASLGLYQNKKNTNDFKVNKVFRNKIFYLQTLIRKPL